MKYIDELSLKDKKVFIRADLDVPLNEDRTVANDTRIRALLPTLQFALDAGAKVILGAHMGRPKGEKNSKYSLAPVAKHLAGLISAEVIMAGDCIGAEVEQQVANLKSGQVLVLENMRFYNGEEKNDPEFAKQLAGLADVYINDAFATSHRAHASSAGMAAFFKEKAAGFNLKKELEYFDKAMKNPKRPLATIFGGSKVSTKMQAIKNVGKTADIIVIGGAMANTFFAADGLNVGLSLYESDEVENARQIKKDLEASGCKLILPVDVVVAEKFEDNANSKTVDITKISDADMVLDIGKKTVQIIADALKDANTIVWNGPVGAFETEGFAEGTYSVVDLLVQCGENGALTVVGGGDTDRALHEKHAADKMGYVSTAGGAFLELMEGKVLPAVAALG